MLINVTAFQINIIIQLSFYYVCPSTFILLNAPFFSITRMIIPRTAGTFIVSTTLNTRLKIHFFDKIKMLTKKQRKSSSLTQTQLMEKLIVIDL